MCGPAAGSASCSACDASKALFESNFELPSCPSIYINSHSIYIIPSHCIILYLQCAGLCRPLPLSHWGWNTRGLPRHSFAKNKARGSCIIDGISFRERSSLLKFALHLAIGCLWWCLHDACMATKMVKDCEGPKVWDARFSLSRRRCCQASWWSFVAGATSGARHWCQTQWRWHRILEFTCHAMGADAKRCWWYW